MKLSPFIHAAEAVVVALLAVGIAYFFPEHKLEAGTIAVAALSGLTKFARSSPSVPVKDWVNE